MENEVYEKDYGEEFRERADKAKGRDFIDALKDIGFFQAYQEEMNKIPKRVAPILKHYDDYMIELATVKERQPDGSVKCYVDEDLKQEIALKLLGQIPNFPLEEAERIAKGNNIIVSLGRGSLK